MPSPTHTGGCSFKAPPDGPAAVAEMSRTINSIAAQGAVCVNLLVLLAQLFVTTATATKGESDTYTSRKTSQFIALPAIFPLKTEFVVATFSEAAWCHATFHPNGQCAFDDLRLPRAEYLPSHPPTSLLPFLVARVQMRWRYSPPFLSSSTT